MGIRNLALIAMVGLMGWSAAASGAAAIAPTPTPIPPPTSTPEPIVAPTSTPVPDPDAAAEFWNGGYTKPPAPPAIASLPGRDGEVMEKDGTVYLHEQGEWRTWYRITSGD